MNEDQKTPAAESMPVGTEAARDEAVPDPDGEPIPSGTETDDDLELVVESDNEGELRERIGHLEQQLRERHELYVRAVADLDNFRKRARRDIDDALIRGRTDVLRELLPAIDALDLALGMSAGNDAARSILEGMEMVRRQFLTSMERFGMRRVVALGQPFDPTLHDAVGQVETNEHPAGVVCHEVRAGYQLQERLVRPAAVLVAKVPSLPVTPAADEVAAVVGADAAVAEPTPEATGGDHE